MNTAVNKEGASRHLPTGRGVARGQQNGEKRETERPSEPRLQAATAKRTDDERDPYADVPCTD